MNEENKIEAIKKMTTMELLDYLEQVRANAWQEGFDKGRQETDQYAVSSFIEALSHTAGIGYATIQKITQVARNKGYDL